MFNKWMDSWMKRREPCWFLEKGDMADWKGQY